MKKLTWAFALLLCIAAVMHGCYYDKEEVLYPDKGTTGCDTADVKYSTTVSQILTANCTSCHTGAAPLGGGINFDNYTSTKNYLDNLKKRFIGAINQDGTASAMPKGLNKLDDCTIKKLEIWINSGYPDN